MVLQFYIFTSTKNIVFSLALVCLLVSRIVQNHSTYFCACAGSGVERIDTLHFLVGCHKRRLNQALSVLSLSLGFLEYVLLGLLFVFH